MAGESKASYEDTNLILRLYELRREPKMREARAWFMSQYRPQTIDEFIAEFRERVGLPEYLRNLEAIVQQVEWAPRRVEWIEKRIAARNPAADTPPNQQ